jgi:transposase
MKQEQFQNFLARQNIIWQFNLSRAPWWGGQFERMVGLVKRALYKSIGRANLR